MCPTCKKVLENAPVDHPPRPFCSARCKLLDLDNWLSERYCVTEPLPPVASEDEENLH